MAAERQFEFAQAQAEQMERDLEELLNSWRDMPALTTESELRAGLEPQPFSDDPPLYEPLDLEAARQAFDRRLRSEALAARPRPRFVGYVAMAVGGVLAILSGAMLGTSVGPNLRTLISVSLGVLCGLIFHGTLIGRWSQGFNERMRRAARALEREVQRRSSRVRRVHGAPVRSV